MKDLIDGPEPVVIKKWPLSEPNAKAEMPCNAAKELWLKPQMCSKWKEAGLFGGQLAKIFLHELAHFADCATQYYPPGGGVEEGTQAEIKCFGEPLSTQPPGTLGPNKFPL